MLCSDGDEYISKHLLNTLMNSRPTCLIIFLELLDEILIFNLLKIRNVSVIHHCELRLIGRKLPSVKGVRVISRTNPKVTIKVKG